MKTEWSPFPRVKQNQSETRVIVLRSEPLTDAEITQALSGNEGAPWYRALVQMIDDARNEYPATAAGCAGMNNALGMARDVGAHEALTQLLTVLANRVAGD